MTNETSNFGSSGGKPLTVILNPSGTPTVKAGDSFELRVTVTNTGNQSPLIDIYIDERSQPAYQWCVSPSERSERVALSRNSTSEVVFHFQVPPETLPGNYSYLLKVDAPQHYPEDTPIPYEKRIQVLPAIESAVRVSDPTFSVSPASDSQNPIKIQPGNLLQLSVSVDNRSNRVDRFSLICPDLEESWWKVHYPEGLPQPGLVTTADGLDLNPGAQGEIWLFLNPPADALAGRCFATLRLQSANNPDLVLLDTVYLQILPSYPMDVKLRTILGKVRHSAGLFEIKLTNQGNALRDLIVDARSLEEDELCRYTLEPSQVRLLPGTAADVGLQVKPIKLWRRPLYGRGRQIDFAVVLEDAQQLPLPEELPQGTLVWEARPWWQFLLLLLTGLCTLGAIAFLIWWKFFQPPAPPKIIEFSSDNPSYKEVDRDFIRLNWQIRNPKQIQSLSVMAQASNGAAPVRPISYDFSKGIPEPLKESCIMKAMLVCKHIPTEARQAGNYVFELKVFSNQDDVSADASKTNLIAIQPAPPPPPPKIKEFFSTRPVYQEASSFKTSTTFRTQNSGAWGRTLSVNPRIEGQNSSVNSAITEQNSSVNPRIKGQNSSVNSTITGQNSSVNPAIAGQNSSVNSNITGQNSSVNPASGNVIPLSWTISNPKQLQELRLIGRAPNGSVNSELKRYDFAQGIPDALKKFCFLKEELTCINVPTGAYKPGDYVFELTAVPKKEAGDTPISAKTDIIKIKPMPLKISYLRVNGKDADPKYFVPISLIKPIKFATITWNVEGGQDMNVEFLPTPGVIPSVGHMIYPLSQQPASQTLTLKVTNASGQEISQSVTFETFNPVEGGASMSIRFLKVKKTVKFRTYFKSDWRLLDKNLKKDQMYEALPGKDYPIKSIKKFDNSKEQDLLTQTQLRNYWLVEFENQYNGRHEWYVYKPDVEEGSCCTLNMQ